MFARCSRHSAADAEGVMSTGNQSVAVREVRRTLRVWMDECYGHRVVERVHDLLELWLARRCVANARGRIIARTARIIEWLVIPHRWNLNVGDTPNRRLVSSQDDVDVVVLVFRVAIIVDGSGPAEISQPHYPDFAALNSVINARFSQQHC